MFGKFIHDHPIKYSQENLRELLSIHGVICFRGMSFSESMITHVMSKIGKLQTGPEQQAPAKFSDKKNPFLVHLDNNDWLKDSRNGWHTDQTYLNLNYLPVRSLYCTEVDSLNHTEFADVKWLTDKLLEIFPELDDYNAKFYQDVNNKDNYSLRNIFSYCEHIQRKVLRYDNRTELQGSFNSALYKQYCQDLLNSKEIPKFTVKWRLGDFVIFDNNQCPHRRSIENGTCILKRVTTYFWLE